MAGKRLALVNKLDLVFSKYIRSRDSDGSGGYCVTCGQYAQDKQWQCGHFIKRSSMLVRWDEHNAHGQCLRCNHFLGGNEAVYGLRIIEMYGNSEHERLVNSKQIPCKHTLQDLEDLIRYYDHKLREVDE